MPTSTVHVRGMIECQKEIASLTPGAEEALSLLLRLAPALEQIDDLHATISELPWGIAGEERATLGVIRTNLIGCMHALETRGAELGAWDGEM